MERCRNVSKDEGEGSKRKRTSSFNAKKGQVKEVKRKSSGGGKAAKISRPGAGAVIVYPQVQTLALNPQVLEKIFQHIIYPKTESAESSELVVKNVQNLRLVCKQWMETATLVYRRNRSPMIKFGTVCRGSPSRTVDGDMEYFVDDMKNSKLIPFQRYKLIDTFFIIENQRLIEDFMRICGPDVVELELNRFCDHTMKFTPESFPDLNLKQLKKLKFENKLSEKTADFNSLTNEIAYLIETFLGAAETLQEFNFKFIITVNPDGDRMIKRFGDSILKQIPKTIKILTLDVPLNDSHLNALAKGGLQLEKSTLDFEGLTGGGVSTSVIRKLFETQAATLKYLKICNSSALALDFPRFDELLHFEIGDGTFQQFSFPDTFPKLTTLDISKRRDESTCLDLLSSGDLELPLKEIHLPEHFPFPQAPLVKKIAQSFPNISKLNISPGPPEVFEILQEIFASFPNIEELYISFPHKLDREFNTDSVFSGVSEQDCQRIREAGDFDVNLKDVQQQPSFLSLTKLKKLVLGFCADITLTDFIAYLFLEMASLKELHTHIFHPDSKMSMSTKYMGLLRKKLTLKLNDDGRCRYCNSNFRFASD